MNLWGPEKVVLHVRYKSLFFFAQIIVMTSRPEGFKFLWNKKSDCNSNEKARFPFIPVWYQICDFLWNRQNKETTLLFGVLMNKISLCSKRPQKFYLAPEAFLTPFWVESLWSKLSNHFFSLGYTFSVLISFFPRVRKKKNFQQSKVWIDLGDDKKGPFASSSPLAVFLVLKFSQPRLNTKTHFE